MTKKNTLFVVAVLVLIVIFGIQWQGGTTSQELVTQVDVQIEDDLRFFIENELNVWESALAAHDRVGAEPDLNLLLLVAFNAKHLGNLELAKETYDRYFETHTTNYTVYSNYGSVLRLMGDLEGSARAYRQAIALDPDIEAFYMSLVRVLDEMGLHEEVEDVYKDAINEIGQTRALLVALAEWYEEQGDCEKAISHYEVAFDLAETEGIADAVAKDLAAVEASCK
ncbi:tetratricopeptide repeat protein [Candidatus Uhrbacteria bacterium]|jgi:tetratricopeptide (TPR) repeat protein|nr:tetratricopeptide repeat protein [Candidatus Uhrbacteria bacterium]